MAPIRVFRYVEELDAFLVTEEFSSLADRLNLTEWHPVVWIGRLFTLDEDYGEHWFDNWDEREKREQKAKSLGIDDYDLMVVVPGKFAGGSDGPCHSDEIRKAFWTDTLKSLELSYDLIFQVARYWNGWHKEHFQEDYIEDLEERIAQVEAELNSSST
jgi:hypothetical protein